MLRRRLFGIAYSLCFLASMASWVHMFESPSLATGCTGGVRPGQRILRGLDVLLLQLHLLRVHLHWDEHVLLRQHVLRLEQQPEHQPHHHECFVHVDLHLRERDHPQQILQRHLLVDLLSATEFDYVRIASPPTRVRSATTTATSLPAPKSDPRTRSLTGRRAISLKALDIVGW